MQHGSPCYGSESVLESAFVLEIRDMKAKNMWIPYLCVRTLGVEAIRTLGVKLRQRHSTEANQRKFRRNFRVTATN